MKTLKQTTYKLELSHEECDKIIDSLDEINITVNLPDWAKNKLKELQSCLESEFED